MNSSLMDLQAIAALFEYEPVSAILLLLVVGITVVAACVAAALGACAAHDLLKEKRKERLRDVAFARQAGRG
jgi:hypothetical protein